MGWFVYSRKLDERTTTDPSASNIRISNGSVTYKQLMVKLTQLFKETVTQVSRSSELLINSLYIQEIPIKQVHWHFIGICTIYHLQDNTFSLLHGPIQKKRQMMLLNFLIIFYYLMLNHIFPGLSTKIFSYCTSMMKVTI